MGFEFELTLIVRGQGFQLCISAEFYIDSQWAIGRQSCVNSHRFSINAKCTAEIFNSLSRRPTIYCSQKNTEQFNFVQKKKYTSPGRLYHGTR